MATARLSDFFRRLTCGMAAEMLVDHSDPQLVTRALSGHDEAAFQAIVHRHGAMVYRVCWRVLQHPQDTEDAFQATFLILAQKLHTVRKHASLASWLHGVAHRVALKAKAQSAARRCREHQAALPDTLPADDVTWREFRSALDVELGNLADKWRLPLIMCYLEGRTQDEAASQLGWSKSTLRRRLEQAREALGCRLKERGIVWSAALSAVLLSDCVASATPAPTLVALTIEAAADVAAGKAVATAASAKVAVLTQGVVKAMFLTKLKTVTAVLLVVGMITFGGELIYQVLGTGQSAVQIEDGANKQAKQTDEQKDEKSDLAATDQRRAAQAKEFRELALQVAGGVPDEREKAELLRAAAVSRLKAGDRKGHDELLAKALRVVDGLPEDRKGNDTQEDLRDHYKARFLVELAGLQAQAGDPELGRRTAGAIPIPQDYEDQLYFKAQALGSVAWKQADAGDIQGARKTMDQIEESDIYQGHIHSRKAVALFMIASAQAKAGDVKGALATAEDISNHSWRAWALSRVAVAQAMAKDEKGSIRSLERALEFARKIPPTDPPGGWHEREGSLSNAIYYIIEARAVTGDVMGARKLAEDLPENEKESRLAWAFVRLGERQAAAGDVEGARKTADTLLPKGSRERGEVLLAIVKAQLAAGNARGALETAAAIAHWEERALALVAIARAHASQGHSAEAANALRDASSLVSEHKLIPVQERRSRVLIDLSVAWTEIGNLKATLRLINEIPSPREKVYALLAVGEALEAQAKEKVPQKK
jgi:RNA polymerase sigma factor (sigma-70 family)